MVKLPDGYAVSEISSLDALEPVWALWQASVQQPLADPEFYRMICRVRAAHTQPCVLVLSRDGLPLTLLAGRREVQRQPVRIGYATLGHATVRQFRFIAGGLLGDLREPHLAYLLRGLDGLMRRQGIPVAMFEAMEEQAELARALRAGFGGWRRTTEDSASRHWHMTLPRSWDEFLLSKQAKHRYAINRMPRDLDRRFPGRWGIDLYTNPDDAAVFVDAAESIASMAYHRALGVGFRKDEEYVERVRLEAERGRLRGYVLQIDGKPCAFWYAVVYRGTLHLIATAYDPAHKALSPGTVLLLRMFKDHCGTGIGQVDFGLGDAEYKRRFGTESVIEAPVRIFAATARGLALRGMHGALQRINQAGHWCVERLGATQRLKTFWRARLSAEAAATETQ